MEKSWRGRYGPWAVVAGGSRGLGAEYARQLAARGLSLVLVAEADQPLLDLARGLEERHGIQVRAVVVDLAHPASVERVARACEGLEVGLLVCNAAHAPMGPFADQSLEDKLRVVDVNCRAPLALIHAFVPPMVSRGRGGILLMSSLAGLQGSALVAAYAASKAFNLVLGEALWEELRPRGVDVLAVCAGATRTEAYEATAPRSMPLPVMEPEAVVRQALAGLGRGPDIVAGSWNRLAAMVLRRLPRRLAVTLMGRSMRSSYPHRAG